MTEDDEQLGEFMPDGVYAALRHVPLAEVRRHLMPRADRHIDADCDHHNRQQLYHDRDYCPDCKQVVKR